MQIFVSLLRDMVVASETRDTHESQIHEMFQSMIAAHVTDAKDKGDVRETVKLRTVVVDLKR